MIQPFRPPDDPDCPVGIFSADHRIGSPHVGYCSYTANLDWSIFLGLAQTWDQIR
jgi:hypothetical protein